MCVEWWLFTFRFHIDLFLNMWVVLSPTHHPPPPRPYSHNSNLFVCICAFDLVVKKQKTGGSRSSSSNLVFHVQSTSTVISGRIEKWKTFIMYGLSKRQKFCANVWYKMINFYMQFYRLEVCVVVFPLLLLFLFVILIKSTTINHFNKSFLAMSPDRDKVKGALSYQIFKNIFISNQ